MSTLTGKDLNLVKPELTDDHKVTIGTHLPANFQKIDDEFTAHKADFPVESGTWTPTIIGSTVAGNNTYATRVGRYYKIGKLVRASFFIQLSAKDAAMAGNIRIGGLPFTVIMDAYERGGLTISQMGFIDFPANYTQLSGEPYYGSSLILLSLLGSGQPIASIDATAIHDNTLLVGNATYCTD